MGIWDLEFGIFDVRFSIFDTRYSPDCMRLWESGVIVLWCLGDRITKTPKHLNTIALEHILLLTSLSPSMLPYVFPYPQPSPQPDFTPIPTRDRSEFPEIAGQYKAAVLTRAVLLIDDMRRMSKVEFPQSPLSNPDLEPGKAFAAGEAPQNPRRCIAGR